MKDILGTSCMISLSKTFKITLNVLIYGLQTSEKIHSEQLAAFCSRD